MTRSRSISLLACLALVAPASAFAESAAEHQDMTQHCGPKRAATAVIVIHGGGFLHGEPTKTAAACEALGRNGWAVTNVDYPVGDFVGMAQAVEAAATEAARHSRRVFSYGESAGGGLSAMAAARGWVDGAFAWAPVSNVLAWRASRQLTGSVWGAHLSENDWTDFAQLSAASWASAASAPIMVLHGRYDQTVPIAESVALKKLWPTMILKQYKGGHWPNAKVRSTAVACFRGDPPCGWARVAATK